MERSFRPGKGRWLLGMVIVVVTVFGGFTPAEAGDKARIIVKLRDDSVSSAAAGTGGKIVLQVAARTVVVEVASTAVSSVIESYKRRSDVEWVERDTKYHAQFTPNDPCYSSACDSGDTQWYLPRINAPEAWDVTTGSPSIKIAVIDSGVDTGHPDLVGRVAVGPNYSIETTNADQYGHGTHVAGVLGAITNNWTGIASVAPSAQIVSVKVLDQTGTADVSAIAAALHWSTDNGVRIANLSLGGDPSQVMEEAVAYARQRGVLVVAAAGNGGVSTPLYPAGYPGVLAVGASDATNELVSNSTWGSNWGQWVDLVAPGDDIVSTWPRNLDAGNPYRSIDGTSMATPMASAAAALVWWKRPYYSVTDVVERLTETARPIVGSGTLTASGLLDVGGALSDLPVGYRLVASDGGIFSYHQQFHGSAGATPLNEPVVAGMTSGGPRGYWLVARDGGVFSYGNAEFYGSTGGQSLNQPIVGATVSRSGAGYYLVGADGGVFAFGDAQFYGSTGGQRLNKPIMSIVTTATGRGYWLIASDGGVFSFGDAQFHGSTGGQSLNQPVVAAARTASGEGYWLIARDGGVFSFGDAQFYGSTGGEVLAQPIVGIAPNADGEGYYLVASDGGVFAFGGAQFYGSTGGERLNKPVVTIIG